MSSTYSLPESTSLKYSDQKYVQQKPEQIKPITCYFTAANTLNQRFSFQQTVIEYIFESANSALKQKLQCSCKYFFIRYPVLICYGFVAEKINGKNAPKINIYQQTITMDPSYIAQSNNKKIYICTVFTFNVCDNPNILSALIPKIFKCDAKFVNIQHQNMTFNELKIIIGNGNVEDFTLDKVEIYDEIDKKDISMEDVLKLTPKLKNISLLSHPITTSFFESLILVPFQNKLEFVSFQNVRGENFDSKLLLEFLIEKVSPKCKIDFSFAFSPGHTLDEMYEIVNTHDIKNGINLHFGKDEAPEYRCNYRIE